MDTNSKEYKELSCKQFRWDCDFTARAKTEAEVLKTCQAHACSAHGKCDISPEVRKKIRSRLRAVRITD